MLNEHPFVAGSVDEIEEDTTTLKESPVAVSHPPDSPSVSVSTTVSREHGSCNNFDISTLTLPTGK